MRAQNIQLPHEIYSLLPCYKKLQNDNVITVDEPAKKKCICCLCRRKKISSASLKCNTCSRFVCKYRSQKQITFVVEHPEKQTDTFRGKKL